MAVPVFAIASGWDEPQRHERRSPAGSHTLVYVESSNGLIPWLVPVDTSVTTDAVIRTTLHVGDETVTALTPAPLSITGGPPVSQPRARNASVNQRRVPSDP